MHRVRLSWLVVVVITIDHYFETMALDARVAIVSMVGHIGGGSGRAAINYPPYYLGTARAYQ